MRRLVCAGEVVVDLSLAVPHLPERGGDVLADSVGTYAGGAANVMLGARRLGVPVVYAGLLGTGPMAALATRRLLAEGVELPLPPRPDRDTGTVVTLVEPDGERTFVTTLGAEADLDDADLAAIPVAGDDLVYVSGYGLAYPRNGPVLARWLGLLAPTVTVVLDAGPLIAEAPDGVREAALARADWVTCNAREAAALTGSGRGRTVVRLGARGAVLTTPAQEVSVPAYAVPVVDTSGAGDAHTAALIAMLATSDGDPDPLRLLQFANAAAAVAVTRRGPSTGPDAAELAAFLAERT